MTKRTSTKLSELEIGKEANVVAVHGQSAVSKRLMEMGVVPGVAVRVVKSAPFGDPIEIRIRGYKLAVRKNEAQSVEVAY
ncbi:MAG: FeoA domain-containing protein [Pyrinomonadaceae bacterium]|jgi:ferrous iron transport protein A|nr:FeoA domain-containing protein [Blastocatellia bacterium]MCW5958149.1 FeoA domain-containing protein [Pyrinomonadaceae bacterium]